MSASASMFATFYFNVDPMGFGFATRIHEGLGYDARVSDSVDSALMPHGLCVLRSTSPSGTIEDPKLSLVSICPTPLSTVAVSWSGAHVSRFFQC